MVFLINGIPVLVIECKNANKDEAIALGVDQIRRYHRETPELFVSQQLFTATDAIGFSYGVSWNTVRRNIFNWKDAEVGKLEAKVKSFCAIPQVLAFLKDYIVFAEKDEELNKYILRQLFRCLPVIHIPHHQGENILLMPFNQHCICRLLPLQHQLYYRNIIQLFVHVYV